jgi:proline racemase
MAQLHARGRLPLESDFVNEGLLGPRFVGRRVGKSTVGEHPAVVPTITGRAWLTGTAQHWLAPDDPFPAGFLL